MRLYTFIHVIIVFTLAHAVHADPIDIKLQLESNDVMVGEPLTGYIHIINNTDHNVSIMNRVDMGDESMVFLVKMWMITVLKIQMDIEVYDVRRKHLTIAPYKEVLIPFFLFKFREKFVTYKCGVFKLQLKVGWGIQYDDNTAETCELASKPVKYIVRKKGKGFKEYSRIFNSCQYSFRVLAMDFGDEAFNFQSNDYQEYIPAIYCYLASQLGSSAARLFYYSKGEKLPNDRDKEYIRNKLANGLNYAYLCNKFVLLREALVLLYNSKYEDNIILRNHDNEDYELIRKIHIDF